jgi:hypothetical protein
MLNIDDFSNELRLLIAGGEPDRHQFHAMPLDTLTVNQEYYGSIMNLGTERFVLEAIIDYHDHREVSLFKAGNCFAVLDHKAKTILYAASYVELILHGRTCASELQQWRAGIVELYDRNRQIKTSAPSFVITHFMVPEIPVLAPLRGSSSRFWWHRVHDAIEVGHLVYDASNSDQAYSRMELIKRNVAKVIISAAQHQPQTF